MGSLRQYERTSESQLLDVSNIVSFDQNPSPRDFEMLSVMKSHSQQSDQSASYKANEMVSYSSRTDHQNQLSFLIAVTFHLVP